MEHVYKTQSDAMRQLLELAITCGRGWQSPQTGYIHYCYTLQDETSHHPIPTYENLLFVLALMRSRTADNITDAKTLLQQLLHFQCLEGESKGNFPVYLHEYPFCKDSLWGAYLLPPLYWIYKSFHHVIGSDLKQALKKSLLLLQTYCLKAVQERKVPYQIQLKIATCAMGLGPLVDQGEIEQKGSLLFHEMLKNRDRAYWNSPALLSELIIAYQMISPSLQEGPEKGFLDHLKGTWNSHLNAYCGPGWKEYQNGTEPQVTLYDYFMGYLSGEYSRRCFKDHPVQLQAALLQPIEEKIPEFVEVLELEGAIHGLPWKMVKQKEIAYSLIAKENTAIAVQEKTYSPLKILWGTSQRLRSFICQSGTSDRIDFNQVGNQIELLFSFSESAQVDHSEKNQEISFFIDEEIGTTITVDKALATTFRLGEEVIVSDGKVAISLSFHIESGYGDFFGHLMKSNRPSQRANAGANRFTVYDWQIFLRTLHRSDDCIVKATVKINNLTV
ncbi:MAG: hypothetical protein H0T62_05200 [Parachlamydiaceae bacterium]|nr:hypothetical protein [Parachlamydiaceae bacterium]